MHTAYSTTTGLSDTRHGSEHKLRLTTRMLMMREGSCALNTMLCCALRSGDGYAHLSRSRLPHRARATEPGSRPMQLAWNHFCINRNVVVFTDSRCVQSGTRYYKVRTKHYEVRTNYHKVRTKHYKVL